MNGCLYVCIVEPSDTAVHLQTTLPTVVVSYVIIALLLVMVVTAYPRFRHLYHNHFEAFHRFFGWTATALVWCQVRNARPFTFSAQ